MTPALRLAISRMPTWLACMVRTPAKACRMCRPIPDAQWTTNPDNYQQFFKVYVPGVGTPFRLIDDTGEGADRQLGRAGARFGERRIIWALLQSLNCVFRYLTKSGKGPGLFSAEEALKFCKDFELGWANSNVTQIQQKFPSPKEAAKNRELLTQLLNKLHSAIKPHMIDPATGQCSKVDPGRVQRIFVSTFGFSRGAAQARVFVNWFLELCRLDAQLSGQPGDRTLGSFPVTFDFLGLFDTVASVGMASSSLLWDGHAEWADADYSMRIPDDVPCVHIVAAHEFRRSFPLDSAHVGNRLPAKTVEWVCPGMHSDVGGGYLPKEQGKGVDSAGADMNSRIPLLFMYREARLAGVPLKLELASAAIQKQFRITVDVIKDFNAYLAQCKVKEGSLHDVMGEQRKLFIQWRKTWAERAAEMPFVVRASAADRADLLSANEAFKEEMKDYEAWLKQKKIVIPPIGMMDRREERDNVPGLDSERVGEWGRIETYWREPPPAAAVARLFEDRVHDSHAWFKLTGHEAAEFKAEMEKLVARKRSYEAFQAQGMERPGSSGLTRIQEEWVKLYLEHGEYAPKFTEGREKYFLGAGYLRYRRIYGGADKVRLTQLRRPGDTESAAAGSKSGTVPATV